MRQIPREMTREMMIDYLKLKVKARQIDYLRNLVIPMMMGKETPKQSQRLTAIAKKMHYQIETEIKTRINFRYLREKARVN